MKEEIRTTMDTGFFDTDVLTEGGAPGEGTSAPEAQTGIRRRRWWVPGVVLSASALYFEMLLRFFNRDSVLAHGIYPVLSALGAGLLAAFLVSLFPRRVGRFLSVFLLLAGGVLFATECLLRRSFQMYMTLRVIASGAVDVIGGYTGELLQSMRHGIPVILLFLLPAVLYAILSRWIAPARWAGPARCLLLLLLSAAALGASTLTIMGGSEYSLYKNGTDFDTQTKTFGLLAAERFRIGDLLPGSRSDSRIVLSAAADPDAQPVPAETKYGRNEMDIDFAALAEETDDPTLQSMHSYVASQTPSSKNKYTGLFEGKNLILICAEAWSDAAVDPELTPTLYRMMHEGFYFSDYYQPAWGGSTSTGEFSFLFGIAPCDSLSTMKEIIGNNNYFTPGNMLQREGYFNASYHNGDYNFYDRQKTHTWLGYDSFRGWGNGLEDLMPRWTDDETMLDKTLDTYLDQTPFSTYYMTVSGHAPYNTKKAGVIDHLEEAKAILGDQFEDTTVYYLCCQMELEDALTTTLQKLEDAGIADDTVIAITGDHYPYGLEASKTFGNSRDYLTDLYQVPSIDQLWDRDHNALILWSGCLEHGEKDMACEIAEPTFSLDVTPTLLNLFGLEFDSRLLVGRDVFSDAEPVVFWTNRSWITSKGKYSASSGRFYPAEGEEGAVDEEYIDRISQIVANRLTFSDQIYTMDYYGVLFGPDEVGEHDS